VQGLPDPRRIEDQPRPQAIAARRDPDRAMEAAGAVMVGALNMGEYAYDFTGENVHDGPSRNPHDVTRMTGGSSAAPAAPSAAIWCRSRWGRTPRFRSGCRRRFCGIFGLKPTYGRLSRARSFPFVFSLDHLGPFARNVGDLALAYDAMAGTRSGGCRLHRPAGRAVMPHLAQDIGGIRVLRSPADIFRRTSFPSQGGRRPVSPTRSARREQLRFPSRPRPPAAPLSHHAEGACCISIACASDRTISIRRCATACWRRDDPGTSGRSRAEIPPLVPRPDAGDLQGRST